MGGGNKGFGVALEQEVALDCWAQTSFEGEFGTLVKRGSFYKCEDHPVVERLVNPFYGGAVEGGF